MIFLKVIFLELPLTLSVFTTIFCTQPCVFSSPSFNNPHNNNRPPYNQRSAKVFHTIHKGYISLNLLQTNLNYFRGLYSDPHYPIYLFKVLQWGYRSFLLMLRWATDNQCLHFLHSSGKLVINLFIIKFEKKKLEIIR